MSESELGRIFKRAAVPRVDNTDSGGFSGYASTFNFIDYDNDIIAPGAYASDIQRFLTKGFIGGVGHDHKNPIGKPVELFEDSKGLFLEAILIDTEKAREARKMIVSGVVQELSVGILPLQARKLPTLKDVKEYWSKAGHTPTTEEIARAEGGARLIKRAKLLEVSPVAIAANEQAEIMTFKAGRKISQSTADRLSQICAQVELVYQMLETLLADAGISTDSEKVESMDKSIEKAVPADDFSDLFEQFRSYIKE